MKQLDILEAILSHVPSNEKVDAGGVEEALRTEDVDLVSTLGAAWCALSQVNIEALVNSNQLVVIHSKGIVATLGKKKLFGSGIKYSAIDLSMCNEIASGNYTNDDGRFGKYCIEFGGPGGVLLGRLEWIWYAKRFRDVRKEQMALAMERDRIHDVVSHAFNL